MSSKIARTDASYSSDNAGMTAEGPIIRVHHAQTAAIHLSQPDVTYGFSFFISNLGTIHVATTDKGLHDNATVSPGDESRWGMPMIGRR